jgi:phosphoribosylaminoimidazole-succinocarboxamide synthase
MALWETALDRPVKRGKVRDVYDLGDRLLLVATDRLSAYDWVLPTPIPDKGRVLTGLSRFWFGRLGVANHLISTNPRDADLGVSDNILDVLEGRSMIARKCVVIPFECVVRGYLSGSAWREYQSSGTVCGIPLPEGLAESARIDPIFTPATKAIGQETASALAALSVDLYLSAAAHAETRGVILADTKFEFGHDQATGELLLIDEALTPDSSRYWPLDTYQPGGPQPSFDKQFVRDWLDRSGWDKASPPPALPDEIVALTRSKYVQAYEILTGQAFPWT